MLRETLQHLTDLPKIPPESRRLISIFLDVNHSIDELAQELNEDVFDVVRKLCDPAIKAWLAAMTALRDNERRERALHTLDASLTKTTDRKLLHRAASRVLRHLEVTRASQRRNAPVPHGGCPDAFPPSTTSPPPTAPAHTKEETPSERIIAVNRQIASVPPAPPTNEADRCSASTQVSTPTITTPRHDPSTIHPRAP